MFTHRIVGHYCWLKYEDVDLLLLLLLSKFQEEIRSDRYLASVSPRLFRGAQMMASAGAFISTLDHIGGSDKLFDVIKWCYR